VREQLAPVRFSQGEEICLHRAVGHRLGLSLPLPVAPRVCARPAGLPHPE
jgi:hypothetical protein